MLRVIFQDIDPYTQLGCYSLVNSLEGSENTCKGKMTDLYTSGGERKILFRSSAVSLQYCSCDITRNKVAIVTIFQHGAKRSSRNAMYVKMTEPLSRFMFKIKCAINNTQRASAHRLCPYCEARDASR